VTSTISGKNRLEERAAAILAYTDEDRDAMDDSNPITFAESGPNRFHLMSLFFSDKNGSEDGVQIQEDCDLGEITVKYFNEGEADIELTEGPVYDWALAMYRAW
jgi:hypothetical protein